MDNQTSVQSLKVVLLLLIAFACGEIDPDSQAGAFAATTSRNSTSGSYLHELNKNVFVAIIGAGFSGLAAFDRLQTAGFQKVDVFEASDRIGGRVYPIAFEDGFLQHGAQFVNGAKNPIFELAHRLGVVTGEVEDDTLFENANYQTGICQIDKSQIKEFEEFVHQLESSYLELSAHAHNWNKTVGTLYQKSFRHFMNRKKRTTDEIRNLKALSRFYQTYYEGEWSAPIDKLCLKNFATWDDKTDDRDSSYTLDKYGYSAILKELIKNSSSIHLNSKVSLVDYGGAAIRLKMLDGQFHPTQYDYVISTVPLGHLKAHAKHLFHPQLPRRKLDAIDAFGFGSLLKIFLVYDKPFWSQNTTSIVPIFVEGCSSESYLGRELHTFQVLDWNSNVLVGWLSGNGPRNIDNLSNEELANHVTQHFQQSMPAIDIPLPSKLIRTSWLRDDNFRGSYTYITAEATHLQADPFELLARPVYWNRRPRVLFAGEATHSTVYQTTIGAYLSGRREANRLINYASRNFDSKLQATINKTVSPTSVKYQ